MENSEMDLNKETAQLSPSWLSIDYFQSFLRQKYPASEFIVRDVIVTPIKEKRKELQIFRAEVELVSGSNPERKHFVVKFPSQVSESAGLGKNMLKTESIFLGKISNSMDRMLEKISKHIESQFAPSLFEEVEENHYFTLVEDLSILGFQVGNWREGLDLEHSLAFMRYLAAFHAISNVVLEDQATEFTNIQLDDQLEHSIHDLDSIQSSFYHIISELETWSDGNYFVKAVRRIGETLPKRMAEASKRQPERFKVLVHGDATARKILFKHTSDGEISRVSFSDFERLHVGSFAEDVNRFMNDSPNDNVLLHHSKTLLEEYRKSLNETLESLGKSDLMMSIEDINYELDTQKAVSQFAFFHVLPRARAHCDCDCDCDTLSDSEFSLAYVFASPTYRKLLRIFLQRFDAKGWFDEYREDNKDWPVIMDIWAQMYCQH